jgi:asparagine synthase (glutamine-hydrolysing)
MCGICGILSLGQAIRPEEHDEAVRMNRVLRHRGPDDEGIQVGRDHVLAATRLKIIDLSDAAHLPMSNRDRTVWLTYNGEVTNFRELRRDFRLDDDYEFQSSSDTEVLLHLYQKLGPAAFKELSGMFAFCLVDLRINKAFVVRDFYGIRPLFYMLAGDRLYFASEIKSLMEVTRFRPEIDHEAIYHFLSLAYIPDRLTPFKQIRELQGGCLLAVDLTAGTWTEETYYEVRYEPDAATTEVEATQRLRDEMIDSVRRNLISDAPLGLTLSGGFDTGCMLGITKHLGVSHKLHTFSIKIDEPSYDESKYQHILANYAKTIHHEVVVQPETVWNTLVQHMAFMDEPSGDGAAIPTYVLAEDASDYVKVLLSGEGGDEIFNAYETHMAWKARRLYRRLLPGPARRLIRFGARHLPTDYSKLSFDFLAKRFSQGAELSVPDAHYFWRHSLNAEEKAKLMPDHCAFRPTESFFSDCYDNLDFEDELDRLSVVDIKYFFIGDLMVKNDRMMMAHSIEARFPWMDRILHEYVSTIPSSLRMKGFTRRYLQKQAMRPLVPEVIFNRNNMGLEMPHSLWFMSGLQPLVDQYFTRERIESTGFLNYEAVKTMWDEHRGHKKDQGRSLWCILNLLVWFELFVSKGNYKDLL